MRIILGMIIGGAMGFLVSYFSRCTTGICPLTKNPTVFIILCAVFGAMLARRIK